MNPARAADLAVLADTPLPDGRDVLVRVVDDDVHILGHVPNGATVHLDSREMQGGWLDLPDETAEAVVAALTRVATDPQFAAQGAELSMRQAQDIAATLHVDDTAPGELVLTDSEREVLVAGLNYSSEVRGPVHVEWSEIHADIASDPTYFGDEKATDAYMEREWRSYTAQSEQRAAEVKPIDDLSYQVKRTGRLDLTHPSTREIVAQTINDWGLKDNDDAEIPSEWRRLVEAVDAHNPQDRAAAAVTWDAASRASTIALQTGNTVDDSIAEAAFTDARIAAAPLEPQGTVEGTILGRRFGAVPGASIEGRSDVTRQLGRVNVDRLREVVRIRTEVEPPAPHRSDRYDASERPTPQQGMER